MVSIPNLLASLGDLIDAHSVPVYQDDALVDCMDAGQNLDERRFARPIVADDSKDLTRIEFEIDTPQSGDGSERLLHALGLDHWIHNLPKYFFVLWPPWSEGEEAGVTTPLPRTRICHLRTRSAG
jgi:hypothetical protein